MVEEVNYEPSDKDEEDFFLMYHMSLQPAELKDMTAEYRKWLISRFIAQKEAEYEEMERARTKQRIQI